MKDRQKEQREQFEADLKYLVGIGQGQRIIRYLMGLTNVMGGSFVSDNPTLTAYREGRRSVGVELLSELKQIAPMEYNQMLMSQAQEQETQKGIDDERRRQRRERAEANFGRDEHFD